jgi:hypothetical protein
MYSNSSAAPKAELFIMIGRMENETKRTPIEVSKKYSYWKPEKSFFGRDRVEIFLKYNI